MRKISHSTEETKQIAATFAKKLKGGEVVVLIGELGSGKTTFVGGAAEALGSTAKIKSPTFTLVNVYPTTHRKIGRVVHADFYRIAKTDRTYDDLGLSEFLTPQAVLFIEWPSEEQTKKSSWTIFFEHGAHPDERLITLRQHGRPPRHW